jgi:hypothetical protein
VLLLVVLLDHNILRKDHVVLVTVKVNNKSQHTVPGERGCKERQVFLEREAVDMDSNAGQEQVWSLTFVETRVETEPRE